MKTYKYLFQKYNYKVLKVQTQKDIQEMIWDSLTNKIDYFAYDTETTGLNIIKDKPFLVIFGFAKCVYLWRADFKEATEAMFRIVRQHNKMLFAHNAKFDYHMLNNIGTPIPDDIELSDSIILFRLISPCDDEFQSMRLEKLGEKFVDPTAKFASDIIKERLQKMKAERKKEVCNNYKLLTGSKSFTEEWNKFVKRVRFITKYHEAFDDYKEPTYYDVYLEDTDLVEMYATDDVIIILEFL